MDYGHALAIFGNAYTENDAVAQWIDLQKRPYLKLMTGFFAVSSVIEDLEKDGFNYSSLNTGKIECKGTIVVLNRSAKGKVEEIAPHVAKNTILNPSTEARIDIENKVCQEQEYLVKLGCPVIIPFRHQYQILNDKKIKVGDGADFWVFMPFQKPNPSFGHETIGMPPQPRTLPNFEGQVTFLAYLMRKGYVTEADAPRGEDPKAPFSAAMFGFAKTRAQELSL